MSAASDVKLSDFNNIYRLDNRVAVVTGGSRGLGLHVASGLMQSGCSKIYITSRKADACKSACDALNALPNKHPSAVAIPVPADSSKPAEIARLVSEVRKTTDHIDILFANAGATWGEAFETHPPDAFAKVMNLNVNAIFTTVQKFEPLLRVRATNENPSHVIVTASVAGLEVGTLGKQATYGYSASKAAAIHLTKNLAVELGPRGIVCNAVCPGFYPSKMANGLMEMSGGVDKLAKATPNRRLGSAEDIAGLVVFLAGRASRHMNGAVCVTDGGAMLSSSLNQVEEQEGDGTDTKAKL